MNNFNELMARIKILETKEVIYSHQGDEQRVRELNQDIRALNDIILELMTLNPELGAA